MCVLVVRYSIRPACTILLCDCVHTTAKVNLTEDCIPHACCRLYTTYVVQLLFLYFLFLPPLHLLSSPSFHVSFTPSSPLPQPLYQSASIDEDLMEQLNQVGGMSGSGRISPSGSTASLSSVASSQSQQSRTSYASSQTSRSECRLAPCCTGSLLHWLPVVISTTLSLASFLFSHFFLTNRPSPSSSIFCPSTLVYVHFTFLSTPPPNPSISLFSPVLSLSLSLLAAVSLEAHEAAKKAQCEVVNALVCRRAALTEELEQSIWQYKELQAKEMVGMGREGVCVCVHACVRACVRACMRACVCVCVCVRERERERQGWRERVGGM